MICLSAIQSALNESKVLGVEIDSNVLHEAKACVHRLQTIDIKKALYHAAIDIPISQLSELIMKAEHLQLDPGNSLLQTIRRISEKNEMQQLILRLRGAVSTGNDHLFRKTFNVLSRYDRKQFTSIDRALFVGVLMQYICYACYRSHLDADSYKSIAKQIRHAIACCLSFHVETESIQLANLVVKQQLHSRGGMWAILTPFIGKQANSFICLIDGMFPSGSPTGSPTFGSDRKLGVSTSAATTVQASTTTILQFFDDQRYGQHLSPFYSIEKYPFLRVKSNKKGSGLIGIFFSSNKANATGAAANSQQALMMFTNNRLKKSLLNDELQNQLYSNLYQQWPDIFHQPNPSLNQQVCLRLFEEIQIVMHDRSIDSLKGIGAMALLDKANSTKNSAKNKAISRLTTIPSVVIDIIRLARQNPVYCDEIYLQLCKQLTGNDVTHSRLHGWCLFTLFLHSFPMTFDLIPFLKNFISFAGGSEAAKLSFASNKTINDPSVSFLTGDRERGIDGLNDLEAEQIQSSQDLIIEADALDFIVQLASYCTKLINKIEQSFISKNSSSPDRATTAFVTSNDSQDMAATYRNMNMSSKDIGAMQRRDPSIKGDISQVVSRSESDGMICTMKFHTPTLEVVSRVLNRLSINFEVLLMTGSLYRFEVRYGEIDTPLSILSLLFNRIIGGGRVLKSFSEYYGLKKNLSKSPNVWTDFLLKQFRGMMFYLDEGSDNIFGERSHDNENVSVGIRGGGRGLPTSELKDIPIQVDDIHRVDWDHDFVWDLLLASVPILQDSNAMDENESDDLRDDLTDYEDRLRQQRLQVRRSMHMSIAYLLIC